MLSLFAGLGMLKSTATTVQAADAKSLEDIATHYAEIGQQWATSSEPTHQNKISGVGENWNYFGPGSKSILTSSQKGMNVSTYEALQHSDPTNKNYIDGHSSLEVAARFPYAMMQSGLDHPQSGGISWMGGVGRKISGWLVAILLWLMFCADWLMTQVFNLFKWLNPFYALQYFVTSSGDNFKHSFFAPLMQYLRPLYKAISGISLSVAAFALAIGIMLALMGFVRQGSNYGLGGNLGSKFLKYFLRVIILFGGPLFIGMAAAAMTDEMSGDTNVTNNIGIRQVYSNYVDFAGWAQNSRLALPQTSNSENQLNINGSNAFLPDYILDINTKAADNKTAKTAMNETKGDNNKASLSTVSKAASFLTGTYANNVSINGSDWESYFRTQLLSQAKAKGLLNNNADAKKNPYSMISDDQKYKNAFGEYGNSGEGDRAYNNDFFKDYSLTAKSSDGTVIYENTTNPNGKVKPGDPNGAGLSSIGIYNYLNVLPTGTGINYTKTSQFMGLGSVNAHASAGFIGRGILSIGTYLRMLSLMATATLIVWFVSLIVLEGILKGAPNILKYGLQLASGSPMGFMGVFREFVGMYSRILVGELIIWLFQGSLEDITNEIDKLLTNGFKNGGNATINLAGGQFSPMPFLMDINVMGIVRILEAAGIGFVIFVVLKSYRDILKFIDECIERIMNLIRKTGPGRHMMSMPKTSAAGMNQNSNFANNANSNASDKNESQNDDSMPDLWGDNDGSKSPEKQMGMSNKDVHGHQTARLGEDMMRGLSHSKAGKALGKAAIMAGGLLGGSKLGQKMGLKGRGEGMMAAQKMMKHMAQAQHMAAHPKTADNSARAGMSDGQKKNVDAQEAHRLQKSTNDVVKKAKHFQVERQQKHQQMLDRFDANGKLKKGQNAGDVMAQMAESTDGSYKNSRLRDAMNQYKSAASNSQTLRNRRNRAINNALGKSQNKIAQDKQKLAQAKTPQQKALAQKQLAHDQAQAKRLVQMSDKSNFATDPVKRAMFEQGNKKMLGFNGEGARKATAKDLATAKNRQFTAMTGKSAKTAHTATPEQLKQAEKAKEHAQEVLANKHATPQQRKAAKRELNDANVVLSTGKQYGMFSTPEAQKGLKDADRQEMSTAEKLKDIDKATLGTGYVATDDAKELTSAESVYANRIANAKETVETGQITDKNGNTTTATAEQMEKAKETLAASPAHEIRSIQNQMITTASSVTQDADDYAEQKVAEAPHNSTPAQLNQLRQQAVLSYMQRPETIQQLKSSGLVVNSDPKKTLSQVQEVSRLGQVSHAAMRASLAGIRNEVDGGVQAPSQDLIKDESYRAYDSLPASNRWIDEKHYGPGVANPTTNGMVKTNIDNLLKAYSTNNSDTIRAARARAAQDGLANPLINSQEELQKVSQKMQAERDNMVNVALNHSTAPLTESLQDLHNDFDSMRGTATASNEM